ncbi:hypothetical protein ATANTOWER_010807 [Ataeniobius toweri]|uniref:Uncharacterized protein n=2 Tax=Goodeidae TaxID=28758 RepID=A0ABU7AL17_9TELE|nr:hypothetical protein [Ataeniobius toweri]
MRARRPGVQSRTSFYSIRENREESKGEEEERAKDTQLQTTPVSKINRRQDTEEEKQDGDLFFGLFFLIF